jgi:hypothetical protein
MRSKAWLAAPVLLAHAEVTKKHNIFSKGPKLRYPTVISQQKRDLALDCVCLQDLPNYAQNVVPIHSLPTDWLWCESWCSDDSKSTAKTIDLCNNPRHKVCLCLVCLYEHMHACMYVCMYVCMNVCVYECVYVCCTHVRTHV